MLIEPNYPANRSSSNARLVAAGVFDTHAFSKVRSGKIGPTIVDTTLYVFYTPGTGHVARIDHTNVHALIFCLSGVTCGMLT